MRRKIKFRASKTWLLKKRESLKNEEMKRTREKDRNSASRIFAIMVIFM